MQKEGFKIKVEHVDNLNDVKKRFGIAKNLEGCHTGLLEGYIIEGHVPAKEIKRLVKERPDIAGLAVPGMPAGSPGMEGERLDSYNVLSFDKKGTIRVYARY